MTEQTNLGLIWASAGGTTPVGDVKYEGGWVAEIPTYQNFNYMVQGLDKNILHFAESNSYDWQDDINYAVGAKVTEAGVDYFCITAHINFAPSADTTNSYWVTSSAVGSFDKLLETSGHTIDLPAKSSNTWTGQEQTIYGNTPLTVYNTNAATTNWAIGNMGGELVTVDLGTAATPDLRDLTKGAGNTHRIFHEGHYPDISEVVNGVEEAIADGKIYGRKNNAWTEVTTTVVQDVPAPPVNGAGQGWYNTDDGQLYIDIDDGTSSQWVPASPPMIPEVDAEDVNYVNDIVPTFVNAKETLDLLLEAYSGKNLLINGDFQVWQRGTDADQLDGDFLADRWWGGVNVDASRLTDTNYLASGATYGISVHDSTAPSASLELGQPIELPAAGAAGEFTVGNTFTFSATIWADVSGDMNLFGLFRDTHNHSGNQVSAFSPETFSLVGGTLNNVEVTVTITGTPNPTNLMLDLGLYRSGAIRNYTLSNAKFERGGVASRFEYELYGDVLAKCQRYYFQQDSNWASWREGIDPTAAALVYRKTGYFPVAMRTNPSVEFINATYENIETLPSIDSNRLSSLSYNFEPATGNTFFSLRMGVKADAEL